jgi:DNA invertase Pin-like site-specific DNA recombinase
MYGYIRVSSIAQNEDRQIIALGEFGVSEENIYLDKQSGKDFNRPAYRQLMNKLQSGDIMVVKSIDRLWWVYEEILKQWRIITKEKQAAIVVLDMPLLDTRETEHRDLTGTFIADLVLSILSYVSEQERTWIKQRQREGIDAAKRKGVQFGRPPMERTPVWYELLTEWKANRISARGAARTLGVDRMTFLSFARSGREEGPAVSIN